MVKKPSSTAKTSRTTLKQLVFPNGSLRKWQNAWKLRMADGWTTEKLDQEIDVELRRLQEDIDRAHASYKGQAPWVPIMLVKRELAWNATIPLTHQPRSERKVECRNVEA